jgi:hypothetical protein
MLNQCLSEFERMLQQCQWQDAQSALQTWRSQYPQEPLLKILEARLAYAMGQVSQAEAIFREILKSATQVNILMEARKGLKKIEEDEIRRRKQRAAELANSDTGQGLGFLALLPVSPDNIALRSKTVERLARIMRTDVYTAKFQLPTRYLKIIRMGAIADLQAHGEELRQAEIPAVWISLKAIKDIPLLEVKYFELLGLGEVRALHDQGDTRFALAEVSARVEGILPTYSNVFDIDARHQIISREQVLDRVRICDFHLPKQNLILRFHDSNYQFHQGMQIEVSQPLAHVKPTVQQRWQALMTWFANAMPHTRIHDDFSHFQDMLMMYPSFLKEVIPRIDLFRHKAQLVDNCFEVYSATVFLIRQMGLSA